MPEPLRRRTFPVIAAALLSSAALSLAACGASHTTGTDPTSQPTTTAATLPGTGRPAVTIGDKNFTEQFVLGQLYSQALSAQGYTIDLNPNIGPTEVTMQALYSGRLGMYPEYLRTWNTAVAGNTRSFHSVRTAYLAGTRFAVAHGLELLKPTPFSDTDAIAVTVSYGYPHGLGTIGDLRKVAPMLTLGAPPQFQQSTPGLGTLEQAYGFVPAAFTPLVGDPYQALDQGTVQAADVRSTDGQLDSGNYVLLKDPLRVFGWGQVVPVVTDRVLLAEGPAFAETINKVSSLLSAAAIRQLNAAVDVYNQAPALVAREFLQAHGLLALTAS